ncbi:MAG: hypothetical protein AAFQ99_08385 [Pseudomonadota bacterium]
MSTTTAHGLFCARATLVGAVALLSVMLAACGGGGGGNPDSRTVSTGSPSGSGGTPPPTSGNIEVAWTPPTAKVDGTALTDLAGYRFYLGRESGRYSQMVSVNNPGLSRMVLENLEGGTWFVAMTSMRLNGVESDLSNEVAKSTN